MKTILLVLAISFAVVVLLLAGLGIKMLVRRRGTFKRPCASMDPYTGKGGCQCDAVHRSHCNRPYQPLEVNEELMKEIQ